MGKRRTWVILSIILLQFVEPSAGYLLCSHACHTASSELRVGVDPGWIVVTLEGGKGTLRSFVRAELQKVSRDISWLEPNAQQHTLIAVSGMILITFSPLPVGRVSSASTARIARRNKGRKVLIFVVVQSAMCFAYLQKRCETRQPSTGHGQHRLLACQPCG